MLVPDLKEGFRFVVIDIETSGLEKEKHEIIEIGAVRFIDGKQEDSYNTFVKPRGLVPDFILQLTHITKENLMSGIPVRDALKALTSFVGKDPIVFHNAGFDFPFLKLHAEFQAVPVLLNTVYDTLELSRIYLPFLTNHKLTTVAEFFSITNEGAHRAIHDAQATGLILLHLLDFIQHHVPLAVNYQLSQIAMILDPDSGFKDFLDRVTDYQRQNALLIQKSEAYHIPNRHLIHHQVGKAEPVLLDDIFKESGLLHQQFPSYELRTGQIEMARHVRDAFHDNAFLLVEAGTGVGKSFAYLIPAILKARSSKEQVVISTNTKNLQEQLLTKDLPAIQKIIPLPFKAVLLKGRENYICEKLWKEVFFDITKSLSPYEMEGLLYLVVWKQMSLSGDVSENSSFDKSRFSGLWKKLLADRHFCSGKKCPDYRTCHLMELRREQEDADLIVVNHSLLLSDILSDNATLGKYKHLIIDEAHNLPQIASRHLGISLGFGDFTGFFSMLSHTSKNYEVGLLHTFSTAIGKSMLDASKKDTLFKLTDTVTKMVTECRESLQEMFLSATQHVRSNGSYGKYRIKDIRENPTITDQLERILTRWREMHRTVRSLHLSFADVTQQHFPDYDTHLSNLEGIRDRFEEFENQLESLQIPNLEANAYWLESNNTMESNYPTAIFNYAPLDVSDVLSHQLFQHLESVVFTSATLAIRGVFKYFEHQIGLDLIQEKEIREAVVPSPFDFEKQSALLVTSFLPDPADRFFVPQSADTMKRLIESAQVGSLILFTSYKDLNTVYDLLSHDCYQRNIPLLAQGKGAGRTEILREFREHGNAVLLGTSSFWEGIDVQGESLSLLVINKLPFQVPSEPIIEAYIEKLEREGKNSFLHYMLPNALLKLRQGFGRLIRSKSDRGIVIILDNRVFTKQYGSYFREILPVKCQNVTNILELENLVAKFFRSM